jgi:FtsP/CotA-like multicopper oxidase with cupredoxin domain
MGGSHFSRRDLLRAVSASGAGALLASCRKSSQTAGTSPQETAASQAPSGPADITIRINEVLVDVAKNHTIGTRGYNGSAPGPLIRLREGVPVTVELLNETDTPELVHWHGQIIPADIDGAEEEKSIAVPPHGNIRYRLTPSPAGFRFVHTHVMSGPNLHQGTYTGQFAPVYIEPNNNPGDFDAEIFLSTHEWEPFFMAEGEEEDAEGQVGESREKNHKEEKPNGWEVGYQLFSINGKALGFGDPVRVREGQRVLFHILNGSATENIQLALPGHHFQVIALDGNPVPTRHTVDVLELGTAERVDALVEMKTPGVWILGTPKDDDRKNGMGIVVEYANRSGAPRWIKPPKSSWDYTAFGAAGRAIPAPDETIPMVFGKINGGLEHFNHWTINGKSFDPKEQPQALRKGARYRLAFDNQTDDAHPLHLHRNTFELTKVYGKPAAGVLKDAVLIKPFSKIEVDFTANNPGLTLFHCHQQLHMDYGFKKVFHVA